MQPTLQDAGFGRLYAPDTRDRAYPMRVSPLKAALRRERYWLTGQVLDQGSRPWCVAYSWFQFLISAPVMARAGRPLPTVEQIYRDAQLVDEWPGEDYDGTSVRAGAKVLQQSRLLREYVWARTAEDIRNYILVRGPVVVGTDWFRDMSRPRFFDGAAYLDPTGEVEGGHAWMLSGYSRKRHSFRMINSWGESWGERGRAWITFDALRYLVFQLNGEACSALEVAA